MGVCNGLSVATRTTLKGFFFVPHVFHGRTGVIFFSTFCFLFVRCGQLDACSGPFSTLPVHEIGTLDRCFVQSITSSKGFDGFYSTFDGFRSVLLRLLLVSSRVIGQCDFPAFFSHLLTKGYLSEAELFSRYSNEICNPFC